MWNAHGFSLIRHGKLCDLGTIVSCRTKTLLYCQTAQASFVAIVVIWATMCPLVVRWMCNTCDERRAEAPCTCLSFLLNDLAQMG